MRSGGASELNCVTTGYFSVGGLEFDEMVEKADLVDAITTQAVIEGLPFVQQDALSHHYLGTAWRRTELAYQHIIEAARRAVEAGLKARKRWNE